jgi:hypothetical protein
VFLDQIVQDGIPDVVLTACKEDVSPLPQPRVIASTYAEASPLFMIAAA